MENLVHIRNDNHRMVMLSLLLMPGGLMSLVAQATEELKEKAWTKSQEGWIQPRLPFESCSSQRSDRGFLCCEHLSLWLSPEYQPLCQGFHA